MIASNKTNLLLISSHKILNGINKTMAYDILTHTLPSATPGTQRQIKAHHFGVKGARPKVYLQAGLHADEWPGFLVLSKLITLLKKADQKGMIMGEIIIVPVANPIGLAQNFHGYIPGRFAFSDGGVNFNRHWPLLGKQIKSNIADAITSNPEDNLQLIRDQLMLEVKQLPELTELQALRKTLLMMSMDSDEVIDLHCSGEACMHAYVAQEFESHFLELLTRLKATFALSELDTGAASFDECNVAVWRYLKKDYAHMVPWGCRSLTLELRGENDIAPELASKDATAIFEYLQSREVIEGNAPKSLFSPPDYYPLDAMELVKAPCAGVVVYHKAIGDRIEEGELLAEVIDLMNDQLEQDAMPIIARTHGILFARQQRRLVICGETIAKIAGKEHLAFRKIGHLFED